MNALTRKLHLQIKNFNHLLEIAKRTHEDELVLFVLDELVYLYQQIIKETPSPEFIKALRLIEEERQRVDFQLQNTP